MQLFRRPAVLFLLVALVTVAGSAAPANAQSSTPAVTNIQVRNGVQPGEVVVSWDAVPQATHYRIGYVNMETDYPLAVASTTGEWIEAFVYVDVNARNFAVSGGRAEYTVRRLAQGVRHAFTVLTSSNFSNTSQSVRSEFSWPRNPRWRFFTVLDQGGACPAASVTPPATMPQTPPLQRRVGAAGETRSGEDCRHRLGWSHLLRHRLCGPFRRSGGDQPSCGRRCQHGYRADEYARWSSVGFNRSGSGRGILADLAVVRLPSGRTYATLPLGNSDDLVQGDAITAWGYPFGSFLGTDPTLTRGIVSSTDRIFEDTEYIQTDAAINPGNSGGPVVDRFGRVVGVNTSGLVQIHADGTRVPVPGIYLAVASNEVSNRLSTLAAGGPAQATYRNLRFDYGYSMNVPRGWYLYREQESSSRFLPYATDRYFDITRIRFIEPHGSKSAELSLYANWYWNTQLPRFAAENWVFFQPISLTTVKVAGTDFYRVEYRRRASSMFCVENVVEMISMSASFPTKPYGF